MSLGHQTANRAAGLLGSSSKHICLSCRRSRASQRRYATVAPNAQATSDSSLSVTQPTSRETTAPPTIQPVYTINAGVLLSRAPILTPDPHPFETAYYLYQRRLNERLVLPFTQYFYYQPNTPAFERWRLARKARNGVAARDVGGYNAHNDERWNDEVLVGDEAGERDTIVGQLIEEEGRGGKVAGETARAGIAGLKRMTEADEKNDMRSLERALSRTLYLLVKKNNRPGKDDGFWSFPSGTLEGTEGLKEAAERVLYSSCGPNMNTWFVGNHPVGHHVYNVRNPARITQSEPPSPPPAKQSPRAGEKTFFMKARIFQGQADPKGNAMGVEDFKWLTKHEIQKEVSSRYWASIRHMLAEQ